MITPPREPFNNTASPIASVILISNFPLTNGGFTRIPFNSTETNESGSFDFINSQYVCQKAGLLGCIGEGVVECSPLNSGTHALDVVRNRNGAIKRKRLFQFNSLTADIVSLNGWCVYNVDVGDRISIEYFILSASTTIRLLGDPTFGTDLCSASFFYIT